MPQITKETVATAVVVTVALILLAVLAVFQTGERNLSQIRKAGTIRVLTRNNAHCFYIYRGRKMGFEYELAREFADDLGVGLKVVTPSWEGLIEALNDGTGDFIAASMTITEDREELVDFSDVYLNVQQQIIVHNEQRGINSLEDLAGRVVHTRKGTSYEQRLNELRQNGLDVEIRLYDDVPTEEFIRMVADKEIELTVADSNIAMLNRRYYPEVRIAFPIEESQSLGWAVAKEQEHLLDAINAFFAKIKNDGRFAKIYETHFANVEIFDYVDLRKYHRRLETRLPEYEPLIRKAARNYGFDWRLIAAMVYQESHFNPRARSYTGVRGLMQLTLVTAGELGVEDRLDPTQSINGGVRYLKKLYDRYPEITPPDRIRIALASYNIGAGHVSDARKIARKKGLNPDSWQALKQTLPLLRYSKYYQKARYGYCRGTEPVRYVERIMTYYDILKRKAIL